MRAPGIVYRSQAFGRAVKLPGPFWERGRPIGMGPGDRGFGDRGSGDRGSGDPGRDGDGIARKGAGCCVAGSRASRRVAPRSARCCALWRNGASEPRRRRGLRSFWRGSRMRRVSLKQGAGSSIAGPARSFWSGSVTRAERDASARRRVGPARQGWEGGSRACTVSIRARVRATVPRTAIHLDDAAASLEPTLEVAPYFGLDTASARATVAEVSRETACWRRTAESYGLASAETPRMAGAFEHADPELALRLAEDM